jgi:hypothetical protein
MGPSACSRGTGSRMCARLLRLSGRDAVDAGFTAAPTVPGPQRGQLFWSPALSRSVNRSGIGSASSPFSYRPCSAAPSGTRRLKKCRSEMSLGVYWVHRLRKCSGKHSRIENGLGISTSQSRSRYARAEVFETIGVLSECGQGWRLAGRQGVFTAVFRNPNKNGPFPFSLAPPSI